MPEPWENVSDVIVREVAAVRGYEITIRCDADGGLTMINPTRLVERGKGDLTLSQVLKNSRCQRCKRADRKERGKTLTLRWRSETEARAIGTIFRGGG